MDLRINKINKKLQKKLDKERYEHTIGVMYTASALAMCHNANIGQALLAGLLHDCAKCFSNEKLVAIIDKNLDIEEVEKMNCKTLHAPVSAYIAKTEFGVDDEEILSSIRWHTIGKIGMSDFEKIIFLADKIEARTREESCAGPIRTLLFEDDGLHKALLQCYKQTIKSLVDRNLTICPMTIDIYNSLQAKVK